MSKADTEKYMAWMRENKVNSCVLECNFDREVDDAGAKLLNGLKKEHDMDCNDLDEAEANTDREKQQQSYLKRQKRRERGEVVRKRLLEKISANEKGSE